MKKCDHPNIIKFVGAYMKGEEVFIAMELCNGGAITGLLVYCSCLTYLTMYVDIFRFENHGLGEPEIACVLSQTLSALDYIHSKVITSNTKVNLRRFCTSTQHTRVPASLINT